MVEMLQRHDDIAIRMDVTIAPFDDVEIRRVTVINESSAQRTIDLTSYAEVVLAPPQDDERHPAFNKLFVGSDYIAQEGAFIFERRPRRPETAPPVLLQKLVADDPIMALQARISLGPMETKQFAFLTITGTSRAQVLATARRYP